MLVSQSVFKFVCIQVCSSIFVNNVPTAGPIGTGEAPIDAPVHRNDDGANPGSIGGTWHVARVAARRPAKRR